MVTVKNGNFVINGKPVFLFGGEIHYFRLPKAEWEDRIIKAKEAGCNLVSTYLPWLIHEDIPGDIDLTGRRRPENDLGAFLELIRKHGMYCIRRPGPYVMAELRNEGLPSWIYEQYPGSLALGKDGKTHPTNCMYLLDEDYQGLIDRWYSALGEVIRPYMEENGGPVIMLQLDNEIGMMHWCSGEPDYTPRNVENLRLWLKERYGDSFRERFGGDYGREEFFRFVCDPPEEYAAAVRVDFSRFMRVYFRQYFASLQEKARKYIGGSLYIVNIHGFDSTDIVKRGKQYPIGVAQLSEAAKTPDTVSAGDYYIGNLYFDNMQDIMLANAFTRAVQNPDQPLFSAEFQGGCLNDCPRLQPTTFDLTTRICVANGMDGINYYMFAGGTNVKGTDLLGLRHSWQAPVDTDGSLKPHYPLIRHLGQMFAACSESLLRTRQESVVTLGLVPDYYMTEYRMKNAAICDELRFYREEYLYEGMGKAMSILNLTYDGYNLASPAPLDPEKMPAMAVFLTRYLDAEIQRRLAEYLEKGGRLLIFPTVPVMDMEGRPCTILRDLLGCKAEVHDFGFAEYIDDVENLIVSSSTDFGEVENGFAKHESGYTCGFTKKVGRGEAVVFGVAMQHDFYYRDQVVLNQFEKIGVRPRFTTERLDDKLLLTARADPDGGRYLFVHNLDEYAKTTALFRDGEPLFGGKRLSVRPRSGLMLPLDIQMAPGIRAIYSTAEVSGLEKDGAGWKMTLSLTQPEDEMVLELSGLIPRGGESCAVEALGGGRFRICSRLHGAVFDTLALTLDAC